MTKKNILKEKVKEILEINSPQDRIPLKMDLRKWLRQQPYEFLLPLIEELNMKQLGIIMNLGITREPYKKAEGLMKEYKDNIEVLAETPISEGNRLIEEKPMLDVTLGLGQFDEDQLYTVLGNSDPDDLDIISTWVREILEHKLKHDGPPTS